MNAWKGSGTTNLHGLGTVSLRAGFAPQVERTKRRLLSLLIEAKEQGRSVAGYGAPGKGNTPPTTAASAPTSLTTRWIAILINGACSYPGPMCLSSPGEDSRHQTRLHPYPSLEPDRRDHRPTQLHKDWGARFIVPIPEARVL